MLFGRPPSAWHVPLCTLYDWSLSGIWYNSAADYEANARKRAKIQMKLRAFSLALLLGSLGTTCILAQATNMDSIPGLVFWLRADAGITQSGGVVSVWADQSTNANNAIQATSASRPTYIAAGLNGNPVIRFTGAPVKMGFNVVTAQTVFVVYKDNGTTDDYGDILGDHLGRASFHGDQVSSGKLISGTWASPDVRNGAGLMDGAVTNPLAMPVIQSFHIFGFIPLASVYFSNIANNQDQGDRFRKGDYAEVIAFSGALSNNDRWTVEDYLSAKYAIPVTKSVLSRKVLVYADGDSVTAYGGNYTGFYPVDIPCTVVNVAVSGQSQASMLARLPSYILANKPDIVTISTFLNDMSTAPDVLASNIASYVNQVLATSNAVTGLPPQLILMTDNLSGQNLSTAYPRPYTQQVDTVTRVLAAFNKYAGNPNVHVVNNFVSFDALGGHGNPDTPALFATLLSDMVHPNAAGYDIFHANLKPALTSTAYRVLSPPVTNGVSCSASPPAGSYNSDRDVTLTFPAYAAFTYFTLDGTDPGRTNSPYNGGTIHIGLTNGVPVTLKVVSYDANGSAGPVLTAHYVFAKGTIVVVR